MLYVCCRCGEIQSKDYHSEIPDASHVECVSLIHHQHHHHHLYSSKTHNTKAVIENCGQDKLSNSTYNCPKNRHKSIKTIKQKNNLVLLVNKLLPKIIRNLNFYENPSNFSSNLVSREQKERARSTDGMLYDQPRHLCLHPGVFSA